MKELEQLARMFVVNENDPRISAYIKSVDIDKTILFVDYIGQKFTIGYGGYDTEKFWLHTGRFMVHFTELKLERNNKGNYYLFLNKDSKVVCNL